MLCCQKTYYDLVVVQQKVIHLMIRVVHRRIDTWREQRHFPR